MNMGDEDNKKISDKLNADRSNEEDATYQDSVRNDPAADVDDGVEQIDYDDALERFSGRYQVFTFILLAFVTFSTVYNNNGYIFIGGNQDYTCQVPSNNVTADGEGYLEYIADKCTYSSIVRYTNGTNVTLEQDVACSNWTYDQSDFTLTIRSEFGNSGGPLINLDGEAVGVNSMKVAEGISFAIPADYVKTFLSQADEFKKSRQTKRSSTPAYIGISVLSLTPSVAAQLRIRPEIGSLDTERGLFIVRVYPDSPADRAGLKRYDIITAIDGKPVMCISDLHRATQAAGGKPIKCQICRDGQVQEILLKPQTSD